MRIEHCRRMGSLLLLALCGCTCGNFLTPPGGNSPGAQAAPGAAHAGLKGQAWHGPPPGGPVGANGAGQQLSQTGGIGELASISAQRLSAAEDDRRVLTARVKQLEGQLREKDRALVEASLEIQDATSQITRTREELQRWKNEMEQVRGKSRNVERDSKATLEAIIRTLENFLERERDAGRPPEVAPMPSNK